MVIAGGAPTGDHLSEALGEMKTYILPLKYSEKNFSGMKNYLVGINTDQKLMAITFYSIA